MQRARALTRPTRKTFGNGFWVSCISHPWEVDRWIVRERPEVLSEGPSSLPLFRERCAPPRSASREHCLPPLRDVADFEALETVGGNRTRDLQKAVTTQRSAPWDPFSPPTPSTGRPSRSEAPNEPRSQLRAAPGRPTDRPQSETCRSPSLTASRGHAREFRGSLRRFRPILGSVRPILGVRLHLGQFRPILDYDRPLLVELEATSARLGLSATKFGQGSARVGSVVRGPIWLGFDQLRSTKSEAGACAFKRLGLGSTPWVRLHLG